MYNKETMKRDNTMNMVGIFNIFSLVKNLWNLEKNFKKFSHVNRADIIRFKDKRFYLIIHHLEF